MVGLVVSAAILGIIIAVLERDEFPGWGMMLFCVVVATVPQVFVNALLPPGWWSLLGVAIGAVGVGFALVLLCDLRPPRAAAAVAIYLAIEVALGVGFGWLAG